MSRYVLDASAILALVQEEPGSDIVADAMAEGAEICAINLSEVVAKLAESGSIEEVIRTSLARLSMTVVDFDEKLAFQAGMLRPTTRHLGLSLGDRACIALARERDSTIITADRAWATLSLGPTIRIIR